MARLTSQVWAGIVVILIGVLLLLDTTGLISGVDFSLYIPSVFILVGVYALIRSGFRSIVGPVLVILLAGAWQLSRLDMLSEDVVSTWWPLLLVVVGLAIIVGRWRTANAPSTTDTARVDALALFGGTDRRVTSTAFSGGDVTVAFGGAEIDLRDATVGADGAEIGVLALFGGVDVIVPRNWDVTIDVFPLFGGASDDRLREDREGEAPAALTVSGIVLFGGVTVKD